MECLNDLLHARITETVATTRDEDGVPNVAPMGVLKEDDSVYARLWEDSTTLENVRATERVVVNFTRDPVVYARTALGDDGRRFVADGHLRDADGWVRCDAERVEEEEREEVTRWRLVERERRVVERVLPTHSRGFASVIEATVHATRLDFKPELRELVEHHLEVARKCGDERACEAADLIEERV
ncbi:MAG: DUF447 family protein [Halobacteriales archaeon]|nr:DUF447 family protein [Halobacteriales archaeon]